MRVIRTKWLAFGFLFFETITYGGSSTGPLEATLNHLGNQALLWDNELKKSQKELATVINATNTLSGLVDGVTSSHKLFDATVTELHDAVAELTKSSEP